MNTNFFNKSYNPEDFLIFIRNNMFPRIDFGLKRKSFSTGDFSLNKIKSITQIGESEKLDIALYEITHESENDPRVTLTREAFRFMRDNVDTYTSNALIIFRSLNSENYRFSLLTTDYKRAGKKTEKELSNPRRFSFYLGPDAKVKTPEEFLIKKGAVADIEDLKSRFSVEVVNKEFYLKIADLFYRFIKEAKYPRDSRKKEFAVKLIGRIIFCWFLKKKKSANGVPLIPEELLSLKSLEKFKDYFHSVLEPLFFEVLNTPVNKRKFENLLQIDELSKTIPFLNGGLFEPDNDDIYSKGTGTFNIISIEDSWFSDLFKLLEMYNFTINENSPLDMELSIDPEMLGRVFENLLAELNPETGETARNATGSFYTPRPIVEYMVDESLKAYLSQNAGIKEQNLDKLLSWSDENPELSKDQKSDILNALDKMKSIDPACGSGAYPMGILQKTALILEKVDPDSIEWVMKIVDRISDPIAKTIVEDQLQNEDWSYIHKLGIIQNSIYGIDIQPIAVEISKLRFFLSLIVDAKIDDSAQNRGVKPLPNLEFKIVCADTLYKSPEPLNLETLFGREPFFVELEKLVKSYFGANNDVRKDKLKEEIKSHIKKKVKEKKDAINYALKPAKGTKFEQVWGKEKEAEVDKLNNELELWDSYTNIFNHQKVEFFDTRYFFPDVKDGFDIVIGNPPYIQLQNNNGYLGEKYKDQEYISFAKTGDIYALFYERGADLLKDGGHLCYITSNKWMRAKYGEKLRGYLSEKTIPKILIDFGGYKVFDSATVDTNILLFEKTTHPGKLKACKIEKDFKSSMNIADYFNKNHIDLTGLKSDSWIISSADEALIKRKIEEIGTPLKDWDIQIYRGVLTGFNEAFIIDGATKDLLISEDPKSAEIIKPILRGRDIKKYKAEFADQWLINTHNGYKNVPRVDVNKYPAIKRHLDKYLEELNKRYDKGDTTYNLRNCAYVGEF
ncbi:Eco57I restriction-modification methylase domain-containing protein, partial [bacterium]|nr:Eco57I restriction-modification methylase domain-containing protein [bacterium]